MPRTLPRTLKTVLLVLMLAVLPLRALAAVTTGFCAFAHEHGAPAHHADASHEPHERDSPAHSHDASPCSSCVAHCSSAALAPFTPPASFAVPAATERSVLHERSVAGFIPDHLDPPPLAL